MAIYSMGRRRVIILLILTSILLITLDTRGNAVIDRSRSIFSVMLEPFDAAARTVALPIEDAWHGITNYDDLRRENEALRALLENQTGAEILARVATLEYQQLLQLDRLLGTSSYPTVTARVQGDAPGNFQYTIEIDKGSNDGIGVGMPVVNGAGLVGKISVVRPNSSIVLLAIDPEFAVAAKVLTEANAVPTARQGSPTDAAAPSTATTTTVGEDDANAPATTIDTSVDPLDPVQPGVTVNPPSTSDPDGTASTAVPLFTTTTQPSEGVIRETGTLRGQGPGNPMVIRFVDDSSTAGRVAVGSTVLTAGGTKSVAPAGIPIGVISEVRNQSGSSSLTVEVKLAAGDLAKLSFLRVLLYLPNVSGG